MKVATAWLDKIYDWCWYYEHDSENRTTRARLLKRTSPGCIAELSIQVIDRRLEYYDKKDLMRGS